MRLKAGTRTNHVNFTEHCVPTKLYQMIKVNSRFCYLSPKNGIDSTMSEEILLGLTRKNPSIHPKFFYDERGSELFEEICNLPEYYLARSEMEILDLLREDLSGFLDDHILVELGSGSSKKTRNLLEVFSRKQKCIQYYPIDISGILKKGSFILQRDYKNVKITGILDQYEKGLNFIKSLGQKKVIVFLGSSLGNFNRKGAIKFLRMVRSAMKPGDLLLLGLDLVKDKKILESAYNDSQGITEKFNLNVLARINRDLGADFNLGNFEHVAFYNPRHGRIEMHIRSRCEQKISIPRINLSFTLKKGMTILTEYSYKYDPKQIGEIGKKVGFSMERIWFDKKRLFSVTLFSTKGPIESKKGLHVD